MALLKRTMVAIINVSEVCSLQKTGNGIVRRTACIESALQSDGVGVGGSLDHVLVLDAIKIALLCNVLCPE